MTIRCIQNVVAIEVIPDPHRLGVDQLDGPRKTKSGLHLPVEDLAWWDRGGTVGRVVAVGPGLRDKKGRLRPTELGVGDVVTFNRADGMRWEDVDGRKILFMREPDVTGVCQEVG